MKYNPNNPQEKAKALIDFNKIIEGEKLFELKTIKKTRTVSQNSALHLYFDFVSQELNELGIEFEYKGVKGLDMSCTYTSHIVKEMIWKPMQETLFNTSSTTKLTTDQMNRIIDILTKFFAERGINLSFPSIEQLMNK
jgi:hypothetical protein